MAFDKKRIKAAFRRKTLKLFNWWGPFLGAGIHISKISPDFREAEVEMKLHVWNQNYVGTHFGGSLYAMTDPFYMLMLMENLGPDYIVWDKAANIKFKRPGKGRVRAVFRLTDEKLKEILRDLKTADKVEPHFTVNIVDDEEVVVAEVEKTLYIRRKGTKPRKLRAVG